nr:unnamed protein product [Callosobruchus analis]
MNSHLLKHPETVGDYLKTCSYCSASFRRTIALDEHVIKKHPNCVSSVTTKIHECKQCTYKTTYTEYLRRHLTRSFAITANMLLEVNVI